MIPPQEFLNEVIVPTLELMGLPSRHAAELLLGTALVESRLTYLRQIGGGPALGFYQMEPATHDDIHDNFLRFRPRLKAVIQSIISPTPDLHRQLVTNLAYATAMARVHYLRVSEPLPRSGDVWGFAYYHKKYYNTEKGKATPEKFVLIWERFHA
jgi:hypothetical protein